MRLETLRLSESFGTKRALEGIFFSQVVEINVALQSSFSCVGFVTVFVRALEYLALIR